jgi:hypothetical protein
MTRGSSLVVANAASVRGSQVDDTNLMTPWNAVKAILEYRCTLCWSVNVAGLFTHAGNEQYKTPSFAKCDLTPESIYQQNQCSSHSSMTVSFFMTCYLPFFQTSLRIHRSSGHFQLKEMLLQCTRCLCLGISFLRRDCKHTLRSRGLDICNDVAAAVCMQLQGVCPRYASSIARDTAAERRGRRERQRKTERKKERERERARA